MTQEDKKLLLKDLCARLPYGVMVHFEGWNPEKLSEVDLTISTPPNPTVTKNCNSRRKPSEEQMEALKRASMNEYLSAK